MFNWVLQYFQRCDDFKPPLYLQHQGKDLCKKRKKIKLRKKLNIILIQVIVEQ